MSSMTLLQEEIWWRRSRAFPNFVGAPEADPPYNIQVLAEGDGTRNVLRITFAVTGFSVDGLAVATASCRLRQPVGRATFQAELRARRRGRGAQELERPVKQATVKTVRIVSGETAKMREVFKPKRATVSDAE